MDVKEAVAATAPHDTADLPDDNARRVVTGARALSLGSRMLAARLLGRSVFIRELLPQDLKLEIEQLPRDEALDVAAFLARVVGRGHATQMEAGKGRRWPATLRRSRPKSLNAPSWLWRSVVELVSAHEAAYLEHCRRYAMAEAG